MKWLILICALLTTGPVYAAENYRPATDKEILLIKDSLQTTLKDADSAKFRDVRVAISGVDICGLINSKNSYGAYSGFTYFVGILLNKDGPQPIVDVFGVDSDLGGPAQETCKSNGCCS